MDDKGGGVLASFEFLDSTVDAIYELKDAGHKNLRAYMPFPDHHIEEALGYGESAVRVWTLVGGLTGAATGFALTIWTSMEWPLVTGGKPIVSIPAYVVIAFEMAILFGALATLIGVFVLGRLPHTKPTIVYDAEFQSGRFGLYVTAQGDELDEARRILKRHEPSLLSEDPEGAHVQ